MEEKSGLLQKYYYIAKIYVVFLNTYLMPSKSIAPKNQTQSLKKVLLKKQVLEILYKEGDKTIAELCEVTNNSTPTLTNIMSELGKVGWVHHSGTGESKGGRKPALFGLNSTAGYSMGIELSRRYVKLGLFDLHNKSVGEIFEISEGLDTLDDIFYVLKREVNALLDSMQIKPSQLLGYGITIPGLINIRKGISYSYPQFENKNLSEFFEELLGAPAFIEHDTKAMALGELWFGLAKEKSNVLLINIGSGIGLGQIINGQLYHGHSGFAGEFGHIQMIPDGELCYCGKIGCLETISSGTALVKKAIAALEKGKSSMVAKLVDNQFEKIKLPVIVQAAMSGDQFAIELIEEAGEYLAKGIAILIHLFNPEAVIIAGEMAEANHLITDPIRQKLNKYTMQLLKNDTEILLTELKEKSGMMGTLPVIVNQRLSELVKKKR